jgi:hypothetical protein
MGRIILAAKPFLRNFCKRYTHSELSKNIKTNILFFAKRPSTSFHWNSLRKLLRKLPRRRYPGCNPRLFPWAWVMEPEYEFSQNLRFLTLLNQMGIFGEQFSLDTELAVFPDFCRFYRKWIYKHQSLAWPEEAEIIEMDPNFSEEPVSEESFAKEFPMLAEIGFDLNCVEAGWGYASTRSWGQNLREMSQIAIVIASIGPFWEWNHWNGNWVEFATAFGMSSDKDDELFIEPDSEPDFKLSPEELELLRQEHGYYDQDPDRDSDQDCESERDLWDDYYIPDLEEPEDMDRFLGNRYYKYIGGVQTEVDPDDL